jgi:hypothetical protein
MSMENHGEISAGKKLMILSLELSGNPIRRAV